MAHELDMSNNRANMAYVGDKPWHGLGQHLREGAPIDEWRIAAGMNFELVPCAMSYHDAAKDEVIGYAHRNVIVRSDTREALSCVSNEFKLVQPAEILDFYKELVEAGGYKLHTAGVLKRGRKFWALAKLDEECRIMGQDKVESYLLLATACDGTLATRGMYTSVRVVCNNTLGFAVAAADGSESRNHVRVPHSRKFDAQAVKKELGLAAASFAVFEEQATTLAKRKVKPKEALQWLVDVFGKADKPIEEQLERDAGVMKSVLRLYEGDAKGSNLRSANGTAWGLLNAATEYCDHHARCQSPDARLDRAWFGDGALIKRKAMNAALALAA